MASTPERPNREDPAGRVSAAAPSASAASLERIFPGEGEMARLMRAMDWGATPLGQIEGWPQSLRTAVSICLASRFPILIWWGPELVALYNDGYQPMLGTKHPASLGLPGRRVWPEIWHIIGPMLEGVLHEGRATWSDDQFLPLERKGFSEECYFTFSYSPILDESGSVGGVFCAVTETTARVLAERRARTARDLAAAIVDARTADEVCERAEEALGSDESDLPFTQIYLLDAGGQCARLAGSTGLEAGSRLAPPTVDLTGELSEAVEAGSWPLAEVARTNRRDVATGLASRWGDETVRAGRELTPHTAIILPVTEPGQSTPSAILVAGVSPRLILDDNYEGFYTLLVSHLSAGLAAAHAYEEERKRAEGLAAIDRAKTAFFSNVSHEFRTPLTLMLGPLADLLASDPHGPASAAGTVGSAESGALPSEARAELEVVQRNGWRLLKLVNTLLDFARIEAGRAQAVYEPTDLAAFTAELASTFRSLVEKAGLRLFVDCPPLSQPVHVDRDMWEKIVLNLLSNAFKFTLSGSITVSLRQLPSRGAGGEVAGGVVELEVRDTGTGIPAAELPRLFERFHRIEGARARTHEGSGIGLALVQELVHLHGGTIRAESTEGAGTTFFVRLPLGFAHLPPEAIQTNRTLASTALGAAAFVEEAERWLPHAPSGIAPSAPTSPELAGLPWTARAPAPARTSRIVLADDNADMRDYLRRLLGHDYRVEAVGNGRAALEAIRREPPDLVLADVMMPELDGFELLRALRLNPETANLSVILLSARAGEEATIEGLQAGADDYLVKPFSAREVLSRVAARLEIAQTRREALDRARELEATFEAMADGVAIYDAEGRILRLNPALRELLALDDEYTMRPIGERVPRLVLRDEDGQPLSPEQTPPARVMRGEIFNGASSMDMWARTLDGREVELNVSGTPVRNSAGQIVGGVCIYRDVTERRALEQHTHAVLESLLAMAEVLAESGSVMEPERVEAEAVARVEPAVELDAHRLLPTGDTPVLDATQRTVREVMALAQRVLASHYTAAILAHQETGELRPLGVVGLTWEIEQQWWRDVAEKRAREYLPPDLLDRIYAGEMVVLDFAGQPPIPGQDYFGVTVMLVVPVRLDAQRVVMFGVEARDRAAFTPQERDLAQAATRLVALVVERDRLTREREEAQARERVQRETTRRMDEFLGIASHELRTPLTSITANVQMAERALRTLVQTGAESPGHGPGHATGRSTNTNNGTEPQADQLDRAHTLLERADRQIGRLDRLVGDLVDVSRIHAGRLELVSESCDLVAIVREAVEAQQAAWPGRHIAADLPQGKIIVSCDADRIEQVLTNYLTNALKYSPATAPVRVSVRVLGDVARVEVRDRGPGLSPEQQERLFERFYRVPGVAHQSGSGVGLGLGLYISRTIVERHGGAVGVESEVGQGATFWFTLPLAR